MRPRASLRGFLTVLTAVGGLALVPAAAPAAQLWSVCPSGCGFTSIASAVSDPSVSTGDGIVVYSTGSPYTEQVSVAKKLDIFGSGSPMPVVTLGSGKTFWFKTGSSGSTISSLDIRATGSSGTALQADVSITASNLALNSTDVCAALGAASTTLGPNVTATQQTAGNDPCIDASLAGSETLTGLTVSANSTGVSLGLSTLTNSTVSGGAALTMGGGTVRRSVLNGGLYGVLANPSPVVSLVSDSVVTSTGANGRAMVARGNFFSATPVAHLALRNVTAFASGGNSRAIEAGAAPQLGSGFQGGTIDARNVVARGAVADVSGATCPPGPYVDCAPGTVTIGYSNFVTAAGFLDTTTIGHNQSGEPMLVNPVVGPAQDFHIASSCSPLIGAGTATPDNGPADRDGVTHPTPPSIGAYEFAGAASVCGSPPPAPPAPPGGTAGPSGPGAGATADTIAPVISALSVTPLAFRAARSGGSIAVATGASVAYTLSEAATTSFTVARMLPGQPKGAQCVKPSKRLRRAKRCTRLVPMPGGFSQAAHAGRNLFRFTGRIGGRALRPGSYTLSALASDGAGNRSLPAARSFRIVR
jgi:hypothetical protein